MAMTTTQENRKHCPSYFTLILNLGPRITSHTPSHLISNVTLSEYYYASFVDEEPETRALVGMSLEK